ncbi:MAG: hypothetical protein U9N05_01005 [Euryarchaeota archaeon]|nr:hypothetical protein [Euryarchaeota archaeon]
MPEAISDSSTLIHLAGIGRLKLLKEFYGNILITPAVWDEVVVAGPGRAGADEVNGASNAGWIEVIAPTNESVVRLLERELRDFLPAASNGASCFNHEGFMSTGVNSTQSVPTYRCFSSCSCDFTRDRAIRSRDQASLPNERSDSDDGIVFMSCGAGFIPATSNGVFSRGDYKGVLVIPMGEDRVRSLRGIALEEGVSSNVSEKLD